MSIVAEKPTVFSNKMTINPKAIPAVLRKEKNWVLWKYEERDGKKTKVPYNAVTHEKARSNDRQTWRYFPAAWEAYQKGGWDGIGYMLDKEVPLIVGVDIDKCRDKATGEILEWAVAIINQLDSYTEITPSQTGIRIFCNGRLPAGRRRTGNNDPRKIEIYDRYRFLSLTGNHLDGTPTDLRDRTQEVADLHAELFPQLEGTTDRDDPQEPRPVDAQDTDIVEKASKSEKFAKLWAGKWSELKYPSQSEADLALAGFLAFYCGPDTDRIDRLFRQSALYRDKWERDDYREDVLSKAIDKDEFYLWPTDAEKELCKIFEWTPEELDAHIMAQATAAMPQAEPVTPDPLGLTPVELEEFATAQAVDAQPVPVKSVAKPQPQAKGTASNTKKPDFQKLDYWRTMPKPKWLIRDWIQLNKCTVLYGPSGSCKSFLALDMALSIAYHMPFAGFPTRPGKVAYIYSEAIDGVIKRIDAWKKEHNVTGDTSNLFISQKGYNLCASTEERMVAIDDLADQIEREMGCKPDLLVIDTLSKNYVGSQNDDEDMNAFVKGVEILRTKLDCGIQIVHHTGKDEGREERGSSVLRGAADCSIKVSQDDTGYITVENQKMKDEKDGQATKFTKKRIVLGTITDEYTGTEEISSLVLVPVSKEQAATADLEKKEQQETFQTQALLSLLDDTAEKAITQPEWDAKRVQRFSGRITRAAFRDLLPKFLDESLIEETGKGAGKSPFKYNLTLKGTTYLATR